VLPGLAGDSVVLQSDSNLQIPTAYRQWNFMQKVAFRPSDRWKLEYALHHSQTSAYGRYDRHNRMRNGLPRYAEWEYGPQLWTLNLLSAQHLKKTRWYDQASYRAAVQTFAESRIDRSMNGTDRTVQSEYVTAYSFNADYTRAWGDRHRLFYGLEGVLDDVRSAGEVVHLDTDSTEPNYSRYPQATWYSVGAYASHEWNASPRTTVTSGLRLNAVGLDADFTSQLAYFPLPFASAQVRDEALTGSFGVAHRPNARWTFKANAGTAFRSPNVDDMGKIFDSSPGMVVVPNDQLKSEYAYNADVDIAWKSSAGVKVDFAGYATLLEGALVRRPTTLNGEDSIMYDGELSRVESIQNAAVARVAGVHFAAEVPLAPSWLAYASVNVQNGTEVMDDGTVSAARHAAPVFGTSRLTFRKNRLRADAYVNFQGARAHDRLAVEEQAKTEIYAKDANGQTYCPAWYTANVRATYTTKFGLRAQVGLENLTDVRYRPYSSGVSGAGRSVVVALHVQF
jgi:hemoglobin/transferrin/lactoferrin receptor protein